MRRYLETRYFKKGCCDHLCVDICQRTKQDHYGGVQTEEQEGKIIFMDGLSVGRSIVDSRDSSLNFYSVGGV
jgi:hypothetical protein